MATQKIEAKALKGAVTRTLSSKVRELLKTQRDAELRSAIEGAQGAANKLIARTAAGSRVNVLILVQPGPFGGWNASVMVDAEPSGN